jgi:MoaA/NifB/PqqE/SkfB family radical SAM enzyme
LKTFTPDLVAHGSSLGLHIELLTNGYQNDPELLERIALARPWRVTVSLDGIGDTHSIIRGRNDFWMRTSNTLETLVHLRQKRGLGYSILLKCVFMRQNMEQVAEVARYAREHGLEVFYQPIEQNYYTPEDLCWFEDSSNWPDNIVQTEHAIKELIRLKREGYPILNSYSQLQVMIPYFQCPSKLQGTVQAHTSHEARPLCAAVGMLQIEPNGDIIICNKCPSVGNLTVNPLREIWRDRPRWWKNNACNPSHSCVCTRVG